MLESLLAETLAVTADNLQMTMEILKCAEEAAEDLDPESRQKLNLVHIGLALALEALEDEKLKALVNSASSFESLN